MSVLAFKSHLHATVRGEDEVLLYQQMYLVATAMQLAPCGLGGGDSDAFAVAAGLDYYAETSVGEFLLSGRD